MISTNARLANLEQTIAELEAMDDWHSIVLARADIGIFDWPLQTNKMYLSPSFKKILGYDEHEFLTELDTWWPLFHADDCDQVASEIEAAICSGSDKYRALHRMKHRNGTVIWFLFRASILRSKNRMPTRMIGAAIDVSDVKIHLFKPFETVAD